MNVPVEVQLLRDMLPRSRPSVGIVTLGTPEYSYIKMYPGSASIANEVMIVRFECATRIGHLWASARVTFRIDGVVYGNARPIQFFLGSSDVWSGVSHFPLMSGRNNEMFAGHHTILMRVTT
jgi:hypothetical protein